MQWLEKAGCLLVNVWVYVRFPRLIAAFRKRLGYFPNVAFPKTYHEKMTWRKCFDHNPVFELFCDKLDTKAYVRKICPDMKVPETLSQTAELAGFLDFDLQPNTILKASHGCDMNLFIADHPAELSRLIGVVGGWLRKTHGRNGYQWGYLGLQKRVLLERSITLEGSDLLDISVRCANGQAVAGSVIRMNKTAEKQLGYFDLQGKRLSDPASGACVGNLAGDFEIPPAYFEAVRLAEQLSRGVDYARYDFMFNGRDLYGGEITVYPAAGLSKSNHAFLDDLINTHWDIAQSWFLQTRQTGWKESYRKRLQRAL